MPGSILQHQEQTRASQLAATAGSVQGFLVLRAAQVGSVQCRFVFVFGISVRYTMLFEPALAVDLFKKALAGQLSFAATFAEPNPCVLSE
jgi:hypothetical protein